MAGSLAQLGFTPTGTSPSAPSVAAGSSNGPLSALGFTPSGNPPPTSPSTPSAPGGDLLSKASNFAGSVFPAAQTLGNDIGTLGGFGLTKLNDALTGSDAAKYYDLSAPSPVQAIGAGAATVATGAAGGAPEAAASLVPGLEASAPLGSSIGNGSGFLNALTRVGVQSGISAGIGAASDVAGGDTSPSGIASNALGAGALGAGLAGAGELGAALVENAASQTGVSRLTSQKNTLKTLTTAFNDASTKTTNPITTMEQNGLIKDLRVVDGKVNVEQITNPAGTGSLDTLITDQQDAGTQAIKAMGQAGGPTVNPEDAGVSMSTFKAQVESAIKSNSAIKASGNVSKVLAEVGRRFDDYGESYGKDITYDDLNQVRIAMNKVWNPDTWDAEKAIGNAARSILYNAPSGGTALKSAMANEQELINSKEFVQKLSGTAVKGGRLGKYIADLGAGVVGATVAAPLGPIGQGITAPAAAMAADKIMSTYQSRFFNPMLTKPASAAARAINSPAANSLGGYGKGLLVNELFQGGPAGATPPSR